MKRIVIIDYGMGNLRSVAKAIEHVDSDVKVDISCESKKIAAADRVIFPGQGAAAACMSGLREHHLETAIREAAANKPFLGICMGMQVLMTYSNENSGVHCLDLFAGTVEPFAELNKPPINTFKVPHMGWNQIQQTAPHPLWNGIDNNAYGYFVHSYYVRPTDTSLCLGTSDYGLTFTCALGRDNVFAVQFHPEKSAQTGLRLLKNFINWDGEAH